MAVSRMTGVLLMRALSVRNQRVLVVFLALMVGAAIVNALVSVYFDIDIKMSRELRTFGANFYVGPAQAHTLPEADFDAVAAAAPPGLVRRPARPGRGRQPLSLRHGQERARAHRARRGAFFRAEAAGRTGRSKATGSASISTTATR